MTDFLVTPQGRRIAYNLIDGQGPAVVFCGGFRSDMSGTKAVALEAWAKASGRAFLRFDYSGHGESGGVFEELTISDWLADAKAALGLLAGKVVLVGSSMGGWISLLLSRDMPEKVAGLVTIAAAPDFTEDLMWGGWDAETRATLEREGVVMEPSDYGEPYAITRGLIHDGRNNLVLRAPLALPFPVRLLQGTNDDAVPQEVALRLLAHAEADDIQLLLVKHADHRFSTPDCLRLIERAVEEVLP